MGEAGRGDTGLERVLTGRTVAAALAAAGLALVAPALAQEVQDMPAPEAPPQSSAESGRATGAFEVTVTPLPAAEGEAPFTRMALAKQLSGDLAGTSHGIMLTATTAVEGSAIYVALEEVTGTLDGRSGTFLLQHSGVMVRGEPHLAITVVPDSGTGALAGLAGTMAIRIENGAHFYDLDYTLPAAP